jgi:PPOX class probable F420-dependent enzyme
VGELTERWRRRLLAARVARLATVRPDGRPHVVPITFALVGTTVVTAVDDVKPKSTRALARLANVAAQPWASVLVDHYDDDWATLWWARADGPAEVVVQGAGHAEAVRALAERYPPYRAAPPSGPVIVLAVERWTTWEAAPP